MLNVDQKRILIIDDHTAIHEDFKKSLQGTSPHGTHYQFDSAYRGKDAVEFVRQAVADHEPYALAIVDIRMPPGWDGIVTIKRMWEIDANIQVIICSGYIDYSWEELVKQFEYSNKFVILQKPFDISELRQLVFVQSQMRAMKQQTQQNIETLESSLKVVETKLEESNAALVHHQTYDALTDLPNRALLIEHIQHVLNKAENHDMHVGIFLFDIDNFKKINDSLGHSMGDQFLKKIALRLRELGQKNDAFIARLGGDVFAAVIIDQSQTQRFIAIAHLFLKSLSETYTIKKHSITATSSIGVSIYPTHGKDAATLLKNADSALYAAKKEGINTFKIYRSEFNQHMLKRMYLENALYHAIERNEFVLHYQPIVDLNSDTVTGVEALLRWRHPTLGFIAPMDFIPLAEEIGLIVSIGNWVTQQACTQVQAWSKAGITPVRIAVNVARQQFMKDNFVSTIEKILKKTGCNSNLLELEISENILLEEPTGVIKKMHELKNMGVHLVIDDFGTGRTSLNYLKKFPLEKVKIHRFFIQQIKGNGEDSAIVDEIIALTNTMNVEVVAKGVETYGQLHFLRTHMQGQVQGYMLHKPLEALACFKLLQEKSKQATPALEKEKEKEEEEKEKEEE